MTTTTKTKSTATSDTTDTAASMAKNTIADATNVSSKEKPKVAPKTATTSKNPKTTTRQKKDTVTTRHELGISKGIKEEMSREINEMLSFATYNGTIINTDVISLIQDSNVDDLINAHNMLCKNIAPATPKSIAFVKKLRENDSKKSLFSKIPLVRNLVILAIVFLAIFIATGSSKEVSNASLDLGVMNNNGLNLLLNLAYLASVSGLGVLFYLLKNVSSAVKNGTLVPEDSIYYIALVVLGIIAGLIMSEVLNLYTKDPNTINLFNKSVLALIGGFSSDAIFTVLQSLIDRLKAIFAPSN